MELNATLNATTDLSKQASFRYFGICVALFTIVVGTIGNLLTILAFVSNRKIRTTFNVFIVNLSIVDFITSCLMLPFNLAGYVQMQWPFGNDSFSARVQAYSYFCCGYTSVVFLIAITVNRFVGVVKPGQYRDLFRRNRLVFTLVFCWTFAPISLFPFFIGWDPLCKTHNQALTGFHPQQFVCTFICLPPNGWNAYMQVTRVVFQFLPLAIMISLYGFIFLRMKRKREKVVKSMTISRIAPSLQATVSASGISHSSSTKSKDSRRASDASKKNLMLRKMSSQSVHSSKSRKSDMRMLFISLAICIGFMITFLPSVIVNLIPKTVSIDPRVHMMASNLTWFNASINPIIYVIMNRRFRKEYIRLVRMLFGQVKGNFVRESSTTSIKDKVNRGQSTSTPNTNLIVNQVTVGDSPKRV